MKMCKQAALSFESMSTLGDNEKSQGRLLLANHVHEANQQQDTCMNH